MSQVTVSTFGFEKYIQEATVHPLSVPSYEISIRCLERVMTIFPRSPVWNVIQESAKRPTSSDHISTIIAQNAQKFGPEI